jgi:hypothetical protein
LRVGPAALAAAVFVASSPKLDRLTGLVCMLSPVTPPLSGIAMVGLVALSACALRGAVPGRLDGCRLCAEAAAVLGLACREVTSRKRRSSAEESGALPGCGECRGLRPRGEFVRCAVKAPVCVGVRARAEAAIWATTAKSCSERFLEPCQHNARVSGHCTRNGVRTVNLVRLASTGPPLTAGSA